MVDKYKNLFWAGFRYYCKQAGIEGDEEEKLLRLGLEEAYGIKIKDDYKGALYYLIEEAHSHTPIIDMRSFQKKLLELDNEERGYRDYKD